MLENNRFGFPVLTCDFCQHTIHTLDVKDEEDGKQYHTDCLSQKKFLQTYTVKERSAL